MRSVRAFLRRLAGYLGQDRRERELAAEIESHLDLAVADGVRSGLDPAEARRRAVLRLGGIDAVKEACRDRRGLPFVETTLQDLRYAARSLARNPSFTAVAVATLGVGIGASTTMFSVAHAVLLRPLPYPEPARLVRVTETNPLKGWTQETAAPANFLDWRRSNTAFTDMAGFFETRTFLTDQGEPQRLHALLVTGNLLDVLGVSPRLGRGFTFDETFEGKSRVAILSHGTWHAQFAGDPAIVGRTVVLNGRTYEVVGVMPPGFFFPNRDVQVYLPLGVEPGEFAATRRPHYLSVVARLRPDGSLPRAKEEMRRIAADLERTYPDTNTKMGVRLDGFHATLADDKRPAVLLLLAAVGTLFLVVCSNVANLQLGRAATRAREFAIRQAIGAGRRRLLRQVLTESLCLSLAGGALGLLLAVAGRAALLRFAGDALPSFAELRLDSSVLLFALALTFLTPLLFGMGPAVAAAGAEALRERGGATPGRGRRSLRDAFVAAEAALSVVLVVGAALLTRSLIRLEAVPPGFAADRAVAFAVSFPSVRYPTDEKIVAAVEEMERRVRETPGVQAVGVSCRLPLRGYVYTGDATPEGRGGDDHERELRHNFATPGYFRAVGATLLQGRAFDEADAAGKEPVTIVNETLERIYFRGQDALGKRLKFGRPQDEDPWVTIVGVVADMRQDGLGERVRPEAFTPLAQEPKNEVAFVVRGGGGTEALLGAGRRAVRGVDPELALTDAAPLDELVPRSLGDERFRTTLLAGFAGTALLLAAFGVYGVLAYAVTRRTREIGVRMAVGAPRGRLFAMLMRDGLRPVGLGAALGLPIAYAGAVFSRSLLFDVAPADPAAYALTAAVLGTVALAACAGPAARAMRVDPSVCLRDE